MKDQSVWKQSNDKFRPVFKTKLTWELIRKHEQTVQWSEGVWFQNGTPKFANFHWHTYQDRLAIGDRMVSWNTNINPSCVLCQDPFETRNHLFFECPMRSGLCWCRGYCNQILLQNGFELMELVLDTTGGLLHTFLTRFAFQATIYSLWRERNNRRHGATPMLLYLSQNRLIVKSGTVARHSYCKETINTLETRWSDFKLMLHLL